MISILRKGFILMVLVLFLALLATLIFGGDTLFSHALKKYGPVAFKAPVRFESAQLSVLGGSAGVEQFHVGTEQNPLLDIGSAEINLSTMAILDGRVVIENAQLNGARLHLVIREDGTLSFDSGPPPKDVADADPMPAEDADLPPEEDRDFVQIATEYWERYKHYKEYYDRYGGSLGGEDDGTEDDALERIKFPGVPGYVQVAQQLASGTSEGVFWLEHAEVIDFQWETLDERTKRPVLPVLDNFQFALDNVGTPPSGMTPEAVYAGKGSLADGGDLDFRLGLTRDGNPSSLNLTANALPVASIVDMMGQSFPFKIEGGNLDIGTTDLQFQPNSLSGGVRVVLNGTTLSAIPGSPTVLGVTPKQFCSLLNSALQDQPIAFVIRLGGTPTEPSFTIENETDLGDLLGGAVKAEVERRAQEFVDETLGELQEKASDLIKDKLGDKLPDGIGDQLDEALKGKIDVGNLFGGKKKDG
ncbi:MAG: hypothetical protein COA70_13160 [Planctomycetota bacterium]|nr:MAG: hypothetical protein COA70_13160 [Planctomycetota bacterium]